MSVFMQDPVRYRGIIDGSNSVTMFPSVTGTRWVLTNAFIGFENASTISEFSLIETYDSVSSVFMKWGSTVTSGAYRLNLGVVGHQASETCSGLKMAVDVGATGTGSYSLAFDGYRTGGGY